eukprot:m.7766 g.7766  ORF g.7766 m.7766 type:complete len:50 (-) comp5880_c0_seq1:444-593(-)
MSRGAWYWLVTEDTVDSVVGKVAVDSTGFVGGNVVGIAADCSLNTLEWC